MSVLGKTCIVLALSLVGGTAGAFQTRSAAADQATVPATAVASVQAAYGGLSASFTVTSTSTQPGQAYVLFGTGPGCSGLVSTATRDSGVGTQNHTILVTGNDLAGTVGDIGITPGATYYYEVVTVSRSGAAQVDNNGGACYSIGIPTTPTRGSQRLFIRGTVQNPVVESADFTTVRMPLYTGTAPKPGGGTETVYYALTDTSNASWAAIYGLNSVPKLLNAAGTGAVQRGSGSPDSIAFSGNVDFSPVYSLVGNDAGTGFPPKVANPGAVGDAKYSPLVQLGSDVIDAPIIGNPASCTSTSTPDHSVWADKVVAVDCANHTVTYKLTAGFFQNKVVHYTSFDVSAAGGATLEDATLAPNLANAPIVDNSSASSAREGIIAFTNGQTGATNPNRQGLNSVVLDGLNPLNVVQQIPGNPLYSPLWELHVITWSAASVASHQNTRQTDFDTIVGLTTSTPQRAAGSGPGGAFAASGPVPNCPLFSLEPDIPTNSVLGAP